MRRLVAAVLVALLAVVLTGCGGKKAAETPATPTATAPPASAVPTGAVLVPTDRSNDAGVVWEQFPVGEDLPTSVTGPVSEGQPLLIFFYDSDQSTTKDARKAVNAAMDKFSGLADLVTFDIGKFTSVSANGQAVVETAALVAAPDGSATARLVHTLKVNFTPYVVITDDQGYVIYRQRGPFDVQMLEAQLERVSD